MSAIFAAIRDQRHLPKRRDANNGTLHELEGSDRGAELLSIMHVFNRMVESGLHQSAGSLVIGGGA
jgi:hypothetical protein